MKKAIRWFKNDFDVVSDALCCITGKKIPKIFLILYYVILGIILMPISIGVWTYVKWLQHKYKRFL